MPSNITARTRNRSSSGAFAYPQQDISRSQQQDVPRSQHYTPLVHHPSAVHQPAAINTPPLRPASTAQNSSDLGMSAASRYAHNLKVLRRRDPSILNIFDQFSHVCVYHHNGERWEKKGYEGSMFLYERADYPPFGFYILNRMGMDDYIQRLWPEDNVGVHGNYLMLRTWPDWSRDRVTKIQAPLRGQKLDPFDSRYKWDGLDPPTADKASSQTIGLWMFTTEAREPMIDVMLRLHSYIKQNLPYPEEYRYGPDKPPPPNPHAASTNGAPHRTSSAASSASAASTTSTSRTGSVSNSSSQSRSQRQSPNVGYVNPLLYQATDSTSTASATLKPLEPVDETPKAKKARKRKGKGGRIVEESGDVTPMAKDINQMSDLDMLFARLVLPSGSAAKAASRPASSTAQGPSLLETFMNTDPTPSNSIPHSTTASHQFPSSTSKVTLESLFASAVDSTTSSHLAGTKSMSKTKIALNGHRSTLATTKTGLALLDDIFASASTSSNTTPSGSHLENNDESSESLSVSEDADQPETIEIHSPRPQAPLSLASMFDAAAVDSSPSPSIIPGLGLGLQHMEPAVQEAHPMIFTQQVIDNLLGQGGSMTFRNEPVSSSDRVLNPRSVPTQVNDSKQKGAQNEVLDRLGSGSQTQHHLHLKAGDVSGDVTPRVAVNDIQPIDANKVPLNMHNSLAFSPDPVIPSSVNETANIDYPAFDDDDDEEEAILELDFSDTLALSDLRVFENKERALREQIIERKVASRNASRSTTPAIASQIEVTPLKARSILNGVSNKQILVSTPPPVASQMQAPSTFFGAAVVNPSKVNPTDTSARPSTPASNKKVTIPVTPPTPTSTSAVSATLDGASPSSTKKKTRRGRGKGKDKNREGSPVSEARSRSAVDEPEISPLGAVPEEVQLNGKLAERSGGPTTSVENTPAEINGMTVKDSLDMPSRIKDCLHSALSEKTIDVESKEGLVEFVVKLLQTDRVFVDDLWNAWEGNVGSSVAQVAPHEKHSSPPANTPPSSSETASSLVDEPIQSHETALSAPQLILTQSAPAMLPTLANGARSDVPDLESESSLPASPELQDADNSFMPPMVRDVISLEAERTVIDASAEMGEAPAEGNVDFAQEEETYLVESIL